VLTQAARLDATLAFVADGEEDAKALWQSGDVGGFECYLSADEAGEAAGAADVYRADLDAEDDDLLSVSAAANTLSLVHRRAPAHALWRPALPCPALHTLRFRCCSRAIFPAAISLYRQQDSERLLRRLRLHVAHSEQSFANIPTRPCALRRRRACRPELTWRRARVARDEGIMRFVRYVSASAPGSRWDVSAEFEVCCPEGDSEDDEDEDEDEEEEEE
jgi:hypothetical protein